MEKIRTITCLRHADPNGDHTTISPLGRQQAERCRQRLGEPSFDLIFRSPIPCTDETARVIAMLDGKQWTRILANLSLSREDPGDDIIRAAMEKSDHPVINLRMIFDRGEQVRSALSAKAKDVRGCIYGYFKEREAKKVLVVGHDILIQALCSELCGGGNNFLDEVVSECQGFLIKFNESGEVIGWEKAP